MNDRLRDALANDRHVQVKDLATAMDVTRIALWRAIHAGQIEAVSIGRVYRIPAHEARRLLGLPTPPPRPTAPPVVKQPRVVDPSKPKRGRPRKAPVLDLAPAE